MKLQAREPGRYHVHPMINLSGTGGLVGPGKWITVVLGDRAPSYAVQLTTTNETIDLEHFGWPRVAGWHLIFWLIGLAWLIYWTLKPLLVRYALLLEGVDEEQITQQDRKVSVVFAVIIGMLVMGGLWVTNTAKPLTIPHQTQRVWNLPDIPQPHVVQTVVRQMSYHPTTRSLIVQVEATNQGNTAVLLRKFATSYISFTSRQSLGLYPDPEGQALLMEVEPGEPIQPGETKTLRLTMQDAVWDTDKFIVFDQPQISAAGVLVFIDAQPPQEEVPRQLIVVANDREALGVPWERILSVNEVYASLQLDFAV